jgi:hypothetical protein
MAIRKKIWLKEMENSPNVKAMVDDDDIHSSKRTKVTTDQRWIPKQGKGGI